MNHCDILWVDDFDTTENIPDSKLVTDDTSDTETFKSQLNDYFPESYKFRVNIYKHFLKLLLHLEDHFSQYSCAVLDINLIQGFEWINEGDEDENFNYSLLYKRPEDPDEAIDKVIEILDKYNVCLINDHKRDYKDEFYDKIYKNAGYYLYLYLLQRGMPAERICMLTGNAGSAKDKNLSGKWSELFEKAGLKPPIVFDRQDVKEEKNKNKSDFSKWLDERFSNEYRFRSCVVAMSGCLLDMISKNGVKLRQIWNEVWIENEVGIESVKHILESIRKFPLRFPKGMKHEYINIIWQLVNSWEGIKNIDTSYYTFLKTTRNWIAHRRITELSLQIAAFLFGLSLRGFFDFTSIDDSVKLNYEEYKKWEGKLLNLIQKKDNEDNKSVKNNKDLSYLSLKSFQDIMWRYKKYCNKNQYSINKDVYSMIHELGCLKDKDIVVATDLIREFLHDLCPIIIDRYNNPNFEESKKKITYQFTCKSDDRVIVSNRIEISYLESLHKTLQKAIEDE